MKIQVNGNSDVQGVLREVANNSFFTSDLKNDTYKLVFVVNSVDLSFVGNSDVSKIIIGGIESLISGDTTIQYNNFLPKELITYKKIKNLIFITFMRRDYAEGGAPIPNEYVKIRIEL